MQSDKITVGSDETGLSEALLEAERFGAFMNLNERDLRRLRLLSEETLGMARAITADFVADFWLEGDKEGNCRVCLTVKTAMDYAKKSELIEVATNKSNAASVGIMGKIRDMMENCLYAQNYANSFVGDYCSASPAGLNSGCLWSLNQYRRKTQEEFPNEDNDDFNPALDELEKSIVAHIADEITVAVKGNTAQMIIEKNFGKH